MPEPVKMDPSWYRDQAIVNKFYPQGQWAIMAIYSPTGIKLMDGRYCQQILSAKTQQELDSIREDITDNPHLHPMIKANLLYNIDAQRISR